MSRKSPSSDPWQGNLFDIDPVKPKTIRTELESILDEPKPDTKELDALLAAVNPGKDSTPSNYMKAFSYLLAGVGSFLEIYYYSWRFLQDGTALWLSIICGLGLTGFLIMSSIRRIYWLYIPLVAFSVFATSAGQSYALGEETRNQAIEASRNAGQGETIKELEAERDRLRLSIGSVVVPRSMDTRRKYAEETKTALEQKARDEKSLKVVLDRLDGLRASVVQAPPRENRYQFYSRILGWNAEWVQIIVHTVLSIFVALMAPVSLRRVVW